MPEKDEKRKALDLALSQIEKQYGKGAIMRLGDAGAAMNVSAIPTGALSLDIALGSAADPDYGYLGKQGLFDPRTIRDAWPLREDLIEDDGVDTAERQVGIGMHVVLVGDRHHPVAAGRVGDELGGLRRAEERIERQNRARLLARGDDQRGGRAV